MQGTILPSETTTIHISFAFSLSPSLSLCLFALSSIQYDKTWTVNQTTPSPSDSDSHIFYYFIIKLYAVSIRRKTRWVGYNNAMEALRSYKSDGEILHRFLSLFSSTFTGIVLRGRKAKKFDEAFLLGLSYGELDRNRSAEILL